MSRAKRAVLLCDGDEGECGRWDVDFYAECASSVGGVPIRQAERAPGWTTTGDDDFCPDHVPALPVERAAGTEK